MCSGERPGKYKAATTVHVRQTKSTTMGLAGRQAFFAIPKSCLLTFLA
jgi:hypothetical protein